MDVAFRKAARQQVAARIETGRWRFQLRRDVRDQPVLNGHVHKRIDARQPRISDNER
jgi:hypothetical protein